MVRELHSGETRYFRTWEAFLDFVDSQLDDLAGRDSLPDERA